MSGMREDPDRIAELRTVVVDGFAQMNARFDGLHSQFGGLQSQFGGLQSRFGGLQSQFGGLQSRFDSFQSQVDGLQNQVDLIAGAVVSHDKSIGEVRAIVIRIERRMDRHEHRIERLEDREQLG